MRARKHWAAARADAGMARRANCGPRAGRQGAAPCHARRCPRCLPAFSWSLSEVSSSSPSLPSPGCRPAAAACHFWALCIPLLAEPPSVTHSTPPGRSPSLAAQRASQTENDLTRPPFCRPLLAAPVAPTGCALQRPTLPHASPPALGARPALLPIAGPAGPADARAAGGLPRPVHACVFSAFPPLA